MHIDNVILLLRGVETHEGRRVIAFHPLIATRPLRIRTSFKGNHAIAGPEIVVAAAHNGRPEDVARVRCHG
jgi:hypothetical protein